MSKDDDFSHARPNPCARQLRKKITLRLDVPTIGDFNGLAQEAAIPYWTLINLYLRECAASRKQLHLDWQPTRKKGDA